MIKRAVLWEEEADSEDEVTEQQQQKLQRRLLPGAGDDLSDDSGSEPAVPEPKELFRGNFHCQLCPDKILLNEKALEVHLQSGGHKRNERHFERAKAMGVEAYEAECARKAELRTQATARVGSRKEQKNRDFWERRRAKSVKARAKAKAKTKAKEAKEAEAEEAKPKEEKPESEVRRKVASAKAAENTEAKASKRQGPKRRNSR
ncbi:unnamed protein product [Effrenium voratum]|nr:unnamed protein product [Effrenium voratum]CAJ1459672.1 unnamed protein product [Effrenium voratum]